MQRLYTITECSEMLGVKYKTVYHHILVGNVQPSFQARHVTLLSKGDMAELKALTKQAQEQQAVSDRGDK